MEHMFKVIKKAAFSAGVLAVASSAYALPAFTLDESTVNGTGVTNSVTGDQITLRYTAGINQTALGAFSETGYFSGTGVVNGGAPQGTFMNGPGADGYNFYGTFQVNGTVSVVGTTLLATFATGNVFIYADPDRDTILSLVAGLPVVTDVVGNDDKLLASSVFVLPISQANVPLVGGQAANGGSYVINYGLLNLTTDGLGFFVAPQPFYLNITVTGENESFTPALALGDYTGTAVGDASAQFFAVPEPGSLALIGLGLLGASAARRRKVLPV